MSGPPRRRRAGARIVGLLDGGVGVDRLGLRVDGLVGVGRLDGLAALAGLSGSEAPVVFIIGAVVAEGAVAVPPLARASLAA